MAAGSHEWYRLAPVPHPAAGLSAQVDWAQIPSTGGWYGVQRMDSCRIQADGVLTWHGKAAARVEVKPADDPLDLGQGSERAEVCFLQDSAGRQINETSASGTVYYATSYYFPAAWDGTFIRGNSNSWSLVWQFYGWQGFGAGRGYDANPVAQKYWFGSYSNGTCGDVARGLWTDFVFKVNWGTGQLSVWRRDEGQTSFSLVYDRTGSAPAGSVYMKQGLYRGGDVNGRTDVLWIGPTARGATFAAVEMAAFGTSAGNSVERRPAAAPAFSPPRPVGIYSISGELIRTLPAGSDAWDGTDGRQRPVPAGIYFLHTMDKSDSPPVKIVKLQ